MIKSVKKQFHSCTEKVLPILLSKLGPVHSAEGVAKQLPWKLCLETLSAMFEFMAEWTTKDHAGVICKILQVCPLVDCHRKTFKHQSLAKHLTLKPLTGALLTLLSSKFCRDTVYLKLSFSC